MNIHNPNRKQNQRNYGVATNAFAALNARAVLDPRKKSSKSDQPNATDQSNASPPINTPHPVPPPINVNYIAGPSQFDQQRIRATTPVNPGFQHLDQPRIRATTPVNPGFQHLDQPRIRATTPGSQQNEDLRLRQNADRQDTANMFANLSNFGQARGRSKSREPRNLDRTSQPEVICTDPRTPHAFDNQATEFYSSSAFVPPQSSFHGTYPNTSAHNFDVNSRNMFAPLDNYASTLKRRSANANTEDLQSKRPTFDQSAHELQQRHQARLEKIELENLVENKQLEIEALKSALEKSKCESKLNSTLLAQALDNSKNVGELNVLVERNRELNEKIENQRSELSRLHLSRQKRDSELDVAQKTINELREQARSDDKSYRRLKERFNDAISEKDKMKRNLDALRDENTRLSSERSKQTTPEPNSELVNLRSQLSAKEEEIVKLKNENKELFSSLDQVKSEMAEFEKQWKEHTTKDDPLKAEISERNAQLKEAQDTIESLNKKLADFGNAGNTESTPIDPDKLKQLNDENEKLRQEKTGLTSILQMYLTEIEQLKSEKASQASIKDDKLQEKVTDCAQADAKMLEELADIKSRYELLETSLEDERKNRQELETKKQSLDKELRMTKKFLLDLENANEKIDEFKRTVRKLNAQIADQNAKLEASEKAKNEAEQLYSTTNETLEAQRVSYNELVEKSRQTALKLDEFQTKLDEMSNSQISTPAPVKEVADDESTQLEQSDTSAVGFDPVTSESKSAKDLKTWVSKLTKKLNAAQSAEKNLLTEKEKLLAENRQLKSELSHWRAPPAYQAYMPNPNPFFNMYPAENFSQPMMRPPVNPRYAGYRQPMPRGQAHMNPK